MLHAYSPLRISRLVILLFSAFLLLTSSSALADAKLLPPGTTVQVPGEEERRLETPQFLLPRDMIDRINAAGEVNKRLDMELKRCAEEKRKLQQTEDPKWVTALKWSAVGLAIGGAFTAGLLAGQ